jgi:hypothetical protein
MSFEDTLTIAVDQAIEKAITPARVEKLAYARYEEKIVTISTVADILGKCEKTIRNYVKFGILKPEPRLTDNSPLKFRLSYILQLKPEDLK